MGFGTVAPYVPEPGTCQIRLVAVASISLFMLRESQDKLPGQYLRSVAEQLTAQLRQNSSKAAVSILSAHIETYRPWPFKCICTGEQV
jgi:hypothetical protein